MTEKKIPTVEQLNDFRQQVKTAVTSSDYDKLNAFMDHCKPLAVPVLKDGKFALAAQDGKGTMLSGFEFDEIHYTPEYCYILVKDGVKGFIDSKGAFTTDEEEAYFGAFCD